MLLQHNKNMFDYDLPNIQRAYDCDAYDEMSRLIKEEQAIPISDDDLLVGDD